MGPLEVVVIAFDGRRFNGEIMPALAAAMDSGAIRVIDLTFIRKEVSGRVTTHELAELEEYEAVLFDGVDTIMGLLSVDDIDTIGAALAPDSSAALIVVEHRWLAVLEQKIVGADGRLLGHVRIPEKVARAALDDARASWEERSEGRKGLLQSAASDSRNGRTPARAREPARSRAPRRRSTRRVPGRETVVARVPGDQSQVEGRRSLAEW
jgi:Family of unknown function (DUF6325)